MIQFGCPSLRNNRPSELYNYAASELLKYEKKIQIQKKKDLDLRLKLKQEIKYTQ